MAGEFRCVLEGVVLFEGCKLRKESSLRCSGGLGVLLLVLLMLATSASQGAISLREDGGVMTVCGEISTSLSSLARID